MCRPEKSLQALEKAQNGLGIPATIPATLHSIPFLPASARASLDRGSKHRRRAHPPTAPFTMIRRTRTKHVHSPELGLCLGLEVESARKGGRLSTPLRGFAMTSSGKRSKGAGTCKHRPARNCPARRDPSGRMSRPEKSLQALEKAQNGLGHDRSGPVGSRGAAALAGDRVSDPAPRRVASKPAACEPLPPGIENGAASR